MFRVAFPEIHVAVEDVITDGDKVVVRLTFSGTHTSPLMGIPPTGKFVTITGIAIDRIETAKSWSTRSIATISACCNNSA